MVNRRQLLGSIGAAGTAALLSDEPFALGAGEPSRTAQAAALHRAAHQVLDRPLVFSDPLALTILGTEGQELLHASLRRRQTSASRAMRAFIAMRSRYAEDELAAAFRSDVRQYVVLGAGLDTFACRNPYAGQLRVFEVDHPATQDWKRKQLHKLGIEIPPDLKFAAVDFETDTLGDGLDRAQFDRKKPAFISWLGVSVYLTKEAATKTLRFFPQVCAPGTEIVFDFAVPDEMLSERERSLRDQRATRVSKIGEPWISYFDPNELAADLLRFGFGRAESLTADDANMRYFADRQDGFRVVGSGRIMKASI